MKAGCHPVAIAQVVEHWQLKSEAHSSIPARWLPVFHSSLNIFPSFSSCTCTCALHLVLHVGINRARVEWALSYRAQLCSSRTNLKALTMYMYMYSTFYNVMYMYMTLYFSMVGGGGGGGGGGAIGGVHVYEYVLYGL